MKPAGLLYDTSVYISYRRQIDKFPDPGWFSAVVMQELMAGAADRQDLRQWRKLAADYKREDKLLVPNLAAWETAGLVMHRLLTLEHSFTGKGPAWSNDKKQSLIRDVLIAVSANQHSLAVISDNKDFPLIRQVYDFDWLKAASFFAH